MFGGQDKKLTTFFIVVALKTQAKTTKSTHSDPPKNAPLYNCLLVLLLHAAAVTKDLWGQGSGWGWGQLLPCPNVKPRLHLGQYCVLYEVLFN